MPRIDLELVSNLSHKDDFMPSNTSSRPAILFTAFSFPELAIVLSHVSHNRQFAQGNVGQGLRLEYKTLRLVWELIDWLSYGWKRIGSSPRAADATNLHATTARARTPRAPQKYEQIAPRQIYAMLMRHARRDFQRPQTDGVAAGTNSRIRRKQATYAGAKSNEASTDIIQATIG